MTAATGAEALPQAGAAARAERERSVQTAVDALTTWFDDRFVHLQDFASEMMSVLRIDEHGIIDLAESSRRRLKHSAAHYLEQNPVVDGCGLIFAHSALGTPNGHLEWWVREDESRFARYSFGVVPGADRYYDYEQHEWFIRAFNEGSPALVGPYIDYLGVEAYVLTLTVPAEAKGVRVGAVGNDIQAEDLEAEILPILRACSQELVVVGRHENVLVSNSSRYLPGEQVAASTREVQRVQLLPASRDVQLLIPR